MAVKLARTNDPGKPPKDKRSEESSTTAPLLRRIATSKQGEDQLLLALTLAIGGLTGLAVVSFILLTERLGMRLYPVGSAAWRRMLIPIGGSLGIGYLLYRYFPDARGSGVPQTKAALFAREGLITIGTVLGKFFCTAATLASGIPLGREGPSVQVGGGIASVLGAGWDCHLRRSRRSCRRGRLQQLQLHLIRRWRQCCLRSKKSWATFMRRCWDRWCWLRRHPGLCYDYFSVITLSFTCRNIN